VILSIYPFFLFLYILFHFISFHQSVRTLYLSRCSIVCIPVQLYFDKSSHGQVNQIVSSQISTQQRNRFLHLLLSSTDELYQATQLYTCCTLLSAICSQLSSPLSSQEIPLLFGILLILSALVCICTPESLSSSWPDPPFSNNMKRTRSLPVEELFLHNSDYTCHTF
jgi:hypothetical protein